MQKKRPSFRNLIPLLLCAAIFPLFACSHSSSTSAPALKKQIIPGETLLVEDAFFSTQYTLQLVVRNAEDEHLPAFDIDYSIECDNSEKSYGSSYLSLSSNEQFVLSYVVKSSASSCTYTFKAVRPLESYTTPYTTYIDWTGSYPVTATRDTSSAQN
jgi:hypothetical protein